MTKRIYAQLEVLIILLALAIGIISQFPAFINEYVINDDVRMHIYWMQQFRDSDLFRNDLLTEYAKFFQPWGFYFLYYILSFIVDPINISKVLPVILLTISSLYLFKLVKHITNNYIGFLSALTFMITPIFLNSMVGGNPRSFGYPLLIIFLYYLIKNDYPKSSIVLILQCLFYPIVFLLSILTYLLTFIKIQHKKISFDKYSSKTKMLIIAMLVCSSILCWKHFFSYNPSIGTTVTRNQMVNNPEFYEKGRYKVLPTLPLFRGIVRNVKKGVFVPNIPNLILLLIAMLSISFLALELYRKKIFIPIEILLLFLSSVLMYEISNLLLLKFFVPRRYIEYSIPLISLVLYTIFIGQLISKIRKPKIRKVVQVIVILLVFLSFNIQKEISLIDMSYNKDLYVYLRSLPKNIMIAAHPLLADGIPTFARRKVFIKNELSLPFYDKYWEIVKKRTFDFFNAYYADDPLSVYKFCEGNKIDYLVVNEKDFTKEYFIEKKVYFEPFNTYVINLTENRQHFALKAILERDKLFVKNDIFVINKDILKHLEFGN